MGSFRQVMAAISREEIETRARAICDPLLSAEGLELVDAEYVREGGRWLLRLFIDNPGGTVGLEECTRASNAVDTALEVEDLIPHEYSLEVSSPGLDRPLTKPQHFARAIGKKVKVKTFTPLFDPPRKTFAGILLSASDVEIEIEIDGVRRFAIANRDIAKARLEFEW